MITPVPIPLTLGCWLSSVEKGQRLVEDAFFSLVMFTTQGPALLTASTTGVRRDPAPARDGPEINTIATPRTTAIQYRSPRQRSQGCGTVVVPT
jgi:hypothetical protein